jgi:hypothetical protein
MLPSFSSENLLPGTSIDDRSDALIPEDFMLEPNYPNPFNPITNIAFSLPESGELTLSIYNAAGKLVDVLLDNANCAAGHYSYQWNAGQFSSGIYIAVLQSNTQQVTQKMILMK